MCCFRFVTCSNVLEYSVLGEFAVQMWLPKLRPAAFSAAATLSQQAGFTQLEAGTN